MAFQLDFRLGQRAGLVGTKNIHAAQIENGAEPLDDHLARRHAQRTARQRHGNDHRQKFRRQPDSQGHGEQEGFEPWAVIEGVDEQDEEHQQDRHAHDENAETVDAVLKGRRWRLGEQRVSDLAERRSLPGTAHQHFGRAADDGRSKQHAVAGGEEVLFVRPIGGGFLHRVGFAGEQRLVDEKVLCLQDTAVTGDQIAGRQQSHVARHQIGQRYINGFAVAQHLRPHCHRLTQSFSSLPGPVLLDEIQRHADQNDAADDEETGRITGKC